VTYQHISLATEDAFSVEDAFSIVTMRRARRRNSLSEEHLRELIHAFETLGQGRTRGVILAAEGSVFSSGHDFQDLDRRDLEGMTKLLTVCAELMQLIQSIPQPVIAQVEGLATAGGCQLVASCDLAVAAESASFRTPGGAGGWFCHTPGVAVARAVGRKHALEMLLTGDPIDAHTAVQWGLVNRVVPDKDVALETRALLGRATRGSTYSKAMGKQTFYSQVDLDLPGAYAFATRAMAETSQSADGQEAIRSFLEKRRPTYVGK